MVAEVGVHVDQKIVFLVHGVAHAGENGRAQAQFAGAVHDVNARIGGGQLVGQPARAVRRVVVDHQDVYGRREFVDFSNQRRQVVALVISRQGYQDPTLVSGE